MATAVQTTNPPTTPAKQVGPLVSGALGAAVMLVGLAAAGYGVPLIWKQVVSPTLQPVGGFLDTLLRLVAQVATIGAFAWLGSILLGRRPAKGTRGAIGLILSVLITLFFVVRAVGLNLEEADFGLPITLVVSGGLLGLAFRYLTSDSANRLMIRLEEQGVFSLFNYKPNQGLKARRYTLIGLLLIGWTGVYSLMTHSVLDGDWNLRIPFTGTPGTILTPLSDIGYSVPVLLGVAVFWLAWRAVNMPVFADFLIATEAEMNKVSWSSRKRLVQDTIVVLIFVVLMTLFLMIVDFFWGWLLSRGVIGVLPPRTADTSKQQIDPVQGRKLDW